MRHEKMQWHLIWNSIGISQQLSVIVVGTNLISTLECCALCGNILCTALHVAQIFDGGWILDIFQLDRQKLTCHFLEILQLYGERQRLPSEYFLSKYLKVSIHQEFPPSKFCTMHYIAYAMLLKCTYVCDIHAFAW